MASQKSTYTKGTKSYHKKSKADDIRFQLQAIKERLGGESSPARAASTSPRGSVTQISGQRASPASSGNTAQFASSSRARSASPAQPAVSGRRGSSPRTVTIAPSSVPSSSHRQTTRPSTSRSSASPASSSRSSSTPARGTTSAPSYVSSNRTKPEGPNKAFAKGPDSSLLIKDYLDPRGPDRDNYKGPNRNNVMGPAFYYGPNADLYKGPMRENRQGPNWSILGGPMHTSNISVAKEIGPLVTSL